MKLDGFDILEQLGHGGMATVYRARQLSLDREVAIKVFAPRFEPTPEDREQFQREARVAARLKHPGLVQVYDAVFSGEMYCFVMELVRGYTVAEWGRRTGRLDEAALLGVADAVADALGYAWRQHGLIHCDVKPDNLMIDEDGTVKILDLGLAQTARAVRRQETGLQVYGTPQYISPEQAIGQSDLDCRTDIYSLGATLYQLATGRPLFPDVPDAEAMERQVRGRAPNPRSANPALSPAFATLLEKMLAKDRDRRQPDWDAVRADIAAARDGLPPASGAPLPGSSTVEPGPPPAGRIVRAPAPEQPPAPAPAPMEPTPRRHVRVATPPRPASSLAAPPRRRSPARPLAALLVLGGLAGAGYWFLAQQKNAREAARTLEAAREAVAAIPETLADAAPLDLAEERLRAAARFPANEAVAADALAKLAARRAEFEDARQRKALDELFAAANKLAAQGKYDLAAARLAEYAGPGRDESLPRRKAAVEAFLERKRRLAEDASRREEAAAKWRAAEAARAETARRQADVESQLLDILESSGIAAALDLAEQKAAADATLFSPGSRCNWMRTLLRDAAAAQDAFAQSLRPEGPLTVRLRNGTSLTGRVLRAHGDGELRLAIRAGSADIEQSIRFQELHPSELVKRLGTSRTPGARFVRARYTVLYDLPRPTPRYLDDLCYDFPARLRTLATRKP